MASKMRLCKHCGRFAHMLEDNGLTCCSKCGKVVEENLFSTEVTFFKGAGGQTYAAGIRGKCVEDYSESHERTVQKGRDLISDMVISLGIGGGNSVIDQASGFYRIAVDRNFTRGRSTLLVAAACLYITCRENKKAYLLIDFSDDLKENVYKLGAVFLQLCKLLRLEEHPIIQKPVDPSLFIDRFTERLLGGRNLEVSRTALRIVASMKRDWMQTGRKPSGLCGAALYISALSYGLRYSKSDIVSVVHICEATLTKRLIEFENTESGSLTIEEFNSKADELEREAGQRQQTNVKNKSAGTMELLCQHKGTEEPHFAHGLCRVCYNDFIKLSGGLEGGLEPPAFQRAERDRMAKAAAEEKAAELSPFEKEVECSSKMDHDVIESNKPDSRPSGSIGAAVAPAVDEGASIQSHCDEDTNTVPGDEDTNTVPGDEDTNTVHGGEATNTVPGDEDTNTVHGGEATNTVPGDEDTNTVPGDEDTNTVPGDESESLSDIDDVEVVGYLHNEEERRYKEILWVQMNKEYVEEQALKEAAAAAAKKVREAQFANCSEELRAQMELAELSQAAVAKSRKERQRKKAAEAKNRPPPQTVQEAAHRELVKKRLSSKINFDAFEVLFDDSVPENTKKARSDDLGTHIVNSNINQVVAEEDYEEGYNETTYHGADDSYNKYGYGDDDGFEDYGYEF